ncbi:hypothetical protein [Streptomyces sp. NPDC001435]|uniref:hypothetical protein n=1 Tax=unclassified Streptomyces TaxID=2593676 RepID=UPI003675AE0D
MRSTFLRRAALGAATMILAAGTVVAGSARWAAHTNVKTTKRWYVKPDVEDLRGAATTWDGLHGAAAEETA